jgi:hypothetical protein
MDGLLGRLADVYTNLSVDNEALLQSPDALTGVITGVVLRNVDDPRALTESEILAAKNEFWSVLKNLFCLNVTPNALNWKQKVREARGLGVFYVVNCQSGPVAGTAHKSLENGVGVVGQITFPIAPPSAIISSPITNGKEMFLFRRKFLPFMCNEEDQRIIDAIETWGKACEMLFSGSHFTTSFLRSRQVRRTAGDNKGYGRASESLYRVYLTMIMEAIYDEPLPRCMVALETTGSWHAWCTSITTTDGELAAMGRLVAEWDVMMDSYYPPSISLLSTEQYYHIHFLRRFLQKQPLLFPRLADVVLNVPFA